MERARIFETACYEVYQKFEEKAVKKLQFLIDHFLTEEEIGVIEIGDSIVTHYDFSLLIKKGEVAINFDQQHGTVTEEVLQQYEMEETISLARYKITSVTSGHKGAE